MKMVAERCANIDIRAHNFIVSDDYRRGRHAQDDYHASALSRGSVASNMIKRYFSADATLRALESAAVILRNEGYGLARVTANAENPAME